MKPSPIALRFVAADGAHPQPERQRYTSTAVALEVARETFEVRPDLSVLMRDVDGVWVRLFGPLTCATCTSALPESGECGACTKARKEREAAR